MRDIEIQNALIDYTVKNSCFDAHRNYIGLSQLHRCNREIWNAFFEGSTADLVAKLKCYKGYQMERDLVRRLQCVLEDEVFPGTLQDIIVYDGLVQGHPDFYLNGKPGDVKSVLFDNHVPQHYSKIPARVLRQLQAYMYFLPASLGYVIYESRESGIIRVFSIPVNPYMQQQIREQVGLLVEAVRKRELPYCGCKKCEGM